MSITTDELKTHLDNGDNLTLIEALPTNFYEAEHLPGAINIPHDKINEHIGHLPTNKDDLIVTYCASDTCQNSKHAADTFETLGYTNVAEYVGGKQAWLEAGLTFESSETQGS